MPANNLALCYGRVSTEEQRLGGMSLDVQEERLKLYLSLRGLELHEMILEDCSGGKPLQSREHGKRVLDIVKSGVVGHVVSCKLDRMFRNTIDALRQTEIWDKQGLALHLLDMGGSALDTSSAAGKFWFTMMAGAAEFERNRISERTREGLQYRKAHGLVYSRFAPYGYEKAFDERRLDKHGNPVKYLIEVPQEQEVIRQIRAWRSEEKPVPYWRIAERLNERGVPTKNGGKKWYMNTVMYVLKRYLERKQPGE